MVKDKSAEFQFSLFRFNFIMAVCAPSGFLSTASNFPETPKNEAGRHPPWTGKAVAAAPPKRVSAKKHPLSRCGDGGAQRRPTSAVGATSL